MLGEQAKQPPPSLRPGITPTIASQQKRPPWPETKLIVIPKAHPGHVTSVTKHTIRINGKALKYTVTCGTVVLRVRKHDKDGEALDAGAADVFIAYTLDGVRDPARRPIALTYSFQRRAGLQLGVAAPRPLGPSACSLIARATRARRPHALVDNEHSILTKRTWCSSTRLAPATRAMVAGEGEEFHRPPAILEMCGRKFIRFLHLARNQRWASPKYIAGELRHHARLDGWQACCGKSTPCTHEWPDADLLRTGFQTLRFDHGNDLPPALFCPPTRPPRGIHKARPPEAKSAKLGADLLREVDFLRRQ